jgi:putative acetyltransferase
MNRSSASAAKPVPRSIPWKAWAALLTVYLIWGTTVGCIKIGGETIPVAMLPCVRFFMAGFLIVAGCLIKGERLPDWKTLRTHLIIGTLLFVGGNAWVSWTVQHISTGLSGLTVATTPFWMIFLSSLIPPREKVPGLALIGIAIGFVGMLVLLLPQLTHMQNTSPLFWLSILAQIAITFCWSLGSIYARKHSTGTSLMMSVGLQNLLAGFVLIPFMLLGVHDWQAVHPSFKSLAALAYLILCGSILAMPCYMYVLQTMPVSVASTFAYVTPVITVIVGALFLGEPVTPTTAIGAAIILCAVFVVQLVNQRQTILKNQLAKMERSLAAMNEERYIIRPVETRDNAALEKLVKDTLTEFGCVGPGFASADPELTRMYETYQEADSAYWVIYDTVENKVAGGAGFARLKGTSQEEAVCELQKLYFLPELRGLGFGRKMLELCIEEAAKAGYREMYLESLPQMESAVTMYEKFGFRSLSSCMGSTGHFKCTVFMNRPLQPLAEAMTVA